MQFIYFGVIILLNRSCFW